MSYKSMNKKKPRFVSLRLSDTPLMLYRGLPSTQCRIERANPQKDQSHYPNANRAEVHNIDGCEWGTEEGPVRHFLF